MSDAIQQAIKAMQDVVEALSDMRADTPITEAIAGLQALQSGEPVGYIVPIAGYYKFFDSHADAQEKRNSEEYWDKDLDHVDPKPVYTTPQPVVPEVIPLTRAGACLALWEAIRGIKSGNKTDDKLIFENLRKAGVWLCRASAGKENNNE